MQWILIIRNYHDDKKCIMFIDVIMNHGSDSGMTQEMYHAALGTEYSISR